MDLTDSPTKPEVDHISIVVTTLEGDVDEIRAFGDKERAEEVCESIEEREPWKEVHRSNFLIPADLEDKREEYLAWQRSQKNEQ